MDRRLPLILAALSDIAASATSLTPVDVESAMLFAKDPSRRAPGPGPTEGEVSVTTDISAAAPDDVKRLLSSFPVADSRVDLVWTYECVGVRMLYADFVRHYDDLWYPSRDDLIVSDQLRTWLLVLDHEDVLTFSAVRQD